MKQNIIHTAKATVKMVSSHSSPKGWTHLEWISNPNHENIHIFITHDPATLLLELSPKDITQHTRKNYNLTQCFIREEMVLFHTVLVR